MTTSSLLNIVISSLVRRILRILAYAAVCIHGESTTAEYSVLLLAAATD